MNSPLVKLREMQTAMRELEDAMKVLQDDPALRVEIQFEQDLQAVLAKYGKTIHEAVKVVDPTYTIAMEKVTRSYTKRVDASGNLIKPSKHGGPFTVYYMFTNPHTGEAVRSANILKKEVQVWVKQYGKDEVLKWKTLAPVNQ